MRNDVARERVFRFGRTVRLVGVLTEPEEGATAGAPQPDVLLLCSERSHRAGVSRLHVRLARTLARAGFASLRFDFSGIGDSETRRDGIPFEQSAVLEAREAMDYLASSRGSDRFILMGQGSGAEAALRAALRDERVVGLIQLDAAAYPTLRHRLGHLARSFAAVFSMRPRDVGGWRTHDPDPALPRQVMAAALARLVGRSTELFYFFSGGPSFSYRRQHKDAFPEVAFAELLHVEHLEDADPCITDLRHQEHLVRTILHWVVTRFPRRATRVDERGAAGQLSPASRESTPQLPEPALGPTNVE